MPPFPQRYSKQNFGFTLNSSELVARVQALQTWFGEFIKIVDTRLSSDAQALFRGLLGGRVSTMVAPEMVKAADEADDAEEEAQTDGATAALVRTVWEQQNM